MNKDIKELVKELRRKGYDVEQQRKHFKAYHPRGGLICFAVTPSCHHAVANVRNVIKKLETAHASGTYMTSAQQRKAA